MDTNKKLSAADAARLAIAADIANPKTCSCCGKAKPGVFQGLCFSCEKKAPNLRETNANSKQLFNR